MTTQGRIFRYWSPLLTWLMMAAEGPFLAAIVALLPARILVLIPALTVVLCFERAVLVVKRVTVPITVATVVEVVGVLLVLLITVRFLHMVGAVAAAIALVVGRLGSTGFLVPPSRRAAES